MKLFEKILSKNINFFIFNFKEEKKREKYALSIFIQQ